MTVKFLYDHNNLAVDYEANRDDSITPMEAVAMALIDISQQLRDIGDSSSNVSRDVETIANCAVAIADGPSSSSKKA